MTKESVRIELERIEVSQKELSKNTCGQISPVIIGKRNKEREERSKREMKGGRKEEKKIGRKELMST